MEKRLVTVVPRLADPHPLVGPRALGGHREALEVRQNKASEAPRASATEVSTAHLVEGVEEGGLEVQEDLEEAGGVEEALKGAVPLEEEGGQENSGEEGVQGGPGVALEVHQVWLNSCHWLNHWSLVNSLGLKFSSKG